MAGNTRKIVIIAVAVGLGVFAGFSLFDDSSAANEVLVYKTPTCGCCGKWVEHLEDAGFEVEVQDVNDLTGIKNMKGVPPALRTCHTGVVDGYVVEGHVPARFVKQLLEEKPDIAGIGVAGMPIGSPGMEGAYRESYDVIAFNETRQMAVYGHVQGDPGR